MTASCAAVVVAEDELFVVVHKPPSVFTSIPTSSDGNSEIPAPKLKYSSLPFFLIPAPAVICPAPENCSNTNAVVPAVIGFTVVSTYQLFAFAVPSSTKTNIPEFMTAPVFASLVLVNAFPAQSYIPFCDEVV